jgi:hypothetical protein
MYADVEEINMSGEEQLMLLCAIKKPQRDGHFEDSDQCRVCLQQCNETYDISMYPYY